MYTDTIWIVVLSCISVMGGSCPTEQGYYHLSDVDLCVKPHTGSLIWSDASLSCEAAGDRLVVMDTFAKAAAVKTFASTYMGSYRYIWMGALSYASSTSSSHRFYRTWVWSDCTLEQTSGYWLPGEPSGDVDKCGVIDNDSDGKWNDGPCASYATRFICEKIDIRPTQEIVSYTDDVCSAEEPTTSTTTTTTTSTTSTTTTTTPSTSTPATTSTSTSTTTYLPSIILTTTRTSTSTTSITTPSTTTHSMPSTLHSSTSSSSTTTSTSITSSTIPSTPSTLTLSTSSTSTSAITSTSITPTTATATLSMSSFSTSSTSSSYKTATSSTRTTSISNPFTPSAGTSSTSSTATSTSSSPSTTYTISPSTPSTSISSTASSSTQATSSTSTTATASTSATSSTSTTTSLTSTGSINSYYHCFWFNTTGALDLSDENIAKLIAEIREELLLDTSLLIQTRLKKISVMDERKSAITFGVSGIILLCIPFVLMLLSDCLNLVQRVRP